MSNEEGIVTDIGEYALHSLLESLLNDGERTIGDDCAELVIPGGELSILINVDRLALGIGPELAPELLVAQTISDLIASGGQPKAILVSVQLPRDFSTSVFLDMMGRVRRAAEAYGARLIGGDTKEGPVLAMVGVGIATVTTGRTVKRVHGTVGDRLVVTRAKGALWGRRWASHLAKEEGLPFRDAGASEPELVLPHRESEAIIATGHVRAGIDLSDGLGGALLILGNHNNLGFNVSARALDELVDPSLEDLARTVGLRVGALALSPGYQWENAFLVSESGVEDCVGAARAAGGDAVCVAEATQQLGNRLTLGDGTTVELEVVPDEKFQAQTWESRSRRWLGVMRDGPLGLNEK